MNSAWKLFFHQNPYDADRTGHLFMEAVKENIAFHQQNCPRYAAIIKAQGFDPACLCSEADLYKIPVIPTLYLKRNRLFSAADDNLVIRATSSGTKGLQSQVGFDRKTLFYGVVMMYRFFAYHRVISLMPTNYIILNSPPNSSDNTGTVLTSYGTTRFAPALHREYALKYNGAEVALNIEGIQNTLFRYARQGLPVRFVGLPAYMHALASILKEKGISFKLNPHSKILLGGGWKQFHEINREDFYALIEETLGLKKENCLEFFSAVEHPLPYCKCENGHFHVPLYSRAVVRDVKTLLPLANGEEGLLSFVSPLVGSMPLTSILTDDLGVLHDGADCACRIATPFFELRGRANVQQIKTCATAAAEMLGGMEHESHIRKPHEPYAESYGS